MVSQLSLKFYLKTVLGSPLGTLLGGYLIQNTPNGINGQLRNYLTIFAITLIVNTIGLFWIIIFVNERKTSIQTNLISHQNDNETNNNRQLNDKRFSNSNHSVNNSDEKIESNNNPINNGMSYHDGDNNYNEISYHDGDNNHNDGFFHNLKYLFDFKNIKEVWKCCTKLREHNYRTYIWLIFLGFTVNVLVFFGTIGVLFQFVEKVLT